MIIALASSMLPPLALLAVFPAPGVVAGAVLAGGIAIATTLVAMAGRTTQGPAGVWLMALPWVIRLTALASITALAAVAVPALAVSVVAATGTGCLTALLVDLYRQVTARV